MLHAVAESALSMGCGQGCDVAIPRIAPKEKKATSRPRRRPEVGIIQESNGSPKLQPKHRSHCVPFHSIDETHDALSLSRFTLAKTRAQFSSPEG